MSIESILVRGLLREPRRLLDAPFPELDLSIRLLRRVRLLGRVAAQLDADGHLARFPQVARDQLQSALVINAARKRAALWELDRIAWALRALPDVPIVLLKGCAYELVATPNAIGRAFGDVDILVPEAHLGRVEAELGRHGWRTKELTPYDDQYYRRWTHELPAMVHEEREVEIDIHHNILMRTARHQPSAGSLLAAARTVPGSRFMVLAPTDMALHAMAHLFFGSEMDDALRDLVDIDLLLRHGADCDTGFWQRFWSRAVELDLARAAFYALRYCHRLLETPVPADVLAVSQTAAPNSIVRAAMDRLVPTVMLPRPLEQWDRSVKWARDLLYVRSHWVKMPPFALMRHLAYKFYVRNVSDVDAKPVTT